MPRRMRRREGDVRMSARLAETADERIHSVQRVCLGTADAVEVEAHARARRSPQTLCPEVEAQTIALYDELRSLRKVGARLGITQEAVRQRLRNAGVELTRHRLLSHEEEKQAVALFDQLLSVKAVAAQMHRRPLTIRNALERNNIPVKRGGWHLATREARLQRKIGEAQVMKTLYERLGSERAVAQMLGCSSTLVSGRLRLLGAAPGRGNHGRGRPRRADRAPHASEAYGAG